ncbi:MAG: hypothetical protein QXF76_02355 [Candidatus Anstonellales archaeon]
MKFTLNLFLILFLLSISIIYSVQNDVLKYLKLEGSKEIEIRVRNSQYYWLIANDEMLLFKRANESEDTLVLDEYEIMYVLKTYYNQKYTQVIDNIMNYVIQFNESRKDKEYNCKNMLGHFIHDCNDLVSCYKACYYHPNCQYGLLKTYTVDRINEYNQSEQLILTTLKPIDETDIVQASYAFSSGTKKLDSIIENLIKKLSTFRESFQYKFDFDNDLIEILSTVRTINNNALFEKEKLNYCRKIEYPIAYVNSAIALAKTIVDDKEIDINKTSKRMVERANYYLGLLRKEKGEEAEALFNITNKYEELLIKGNQTLTNAISKFRYDKYFEIRDNLLNLYLKIKNSKSYAEALNISKEFDTLFESMNETINKTEQKVQRINLLRNAALNSALNAEKDNYNAQLIISEIDKIDKILKKDKISDSDISYALTTLERIKAEEARGNFQNDEELNLERIINDYLIFIILGVLIIFGIVLYASRNLLLKQKPGITTIVYKNAQNMYETTLSVRLEKDGNPLPDGTPVTFFVGKGAEVGNTYIQNSYAHATLTFEEFPKEDMDIKIVTTEVEVKLKLHFVPSEDLQREMMTQQRKKTFFDQVLENMNIKK